MGRGGRARRPGSSRLLRRVSQGRRRRDHNRHDRHRRSAGNGAAIDLGRERRHASRLDSAGGGSPPVRLPHHPADSSLRRKRAVSPKAGKRGLCRRHSFGSGRRNQEAPVPWDIPLATPGAHGPGDQSDRSPIRRRRGAGQEGRIRRSGASRGSLLPDQCVLVASLEPARRRVRRRKSREPMSFRSGGSDGVPGAGGRRLRPRYQAERRRVRGPGGNALRRSASNSPSGWRQLVATTSTLRRTGMRLTVASPSPSSYRTPNPLDPSSKNLPPSTSSRV